MHQSDLLYPLQALGIENLILVPFTLASKNCGFSKIAILLWKLLGNNPQTTQKPRQEKPCSGVGFFETPRETLRSYASVNANRRKIVIFFAT